ncbi:MAG: hypothetical protein KKB51_24400 [Candidatus Riflebacteria bacterium]|nr:hypothetical protein [Candidatus Riflebacteria bacterium]
MTLLLAVLSAPVIWNAGRVELSEVNESYIVALMPIKTSDKFRKFENFYAIKLKEMIEKSATPSRNPFNILYQHLWYNTITDGYDLEFWLEPAENKFGDNYYILYLSGNTLFLREEYDGWSRVLDIPFTHSDIEAALEQLPAESVP